MKRNFMVINKPKSKYRQSHSIEVMLVEADSEKNAIAIAAAESGLDSGVSYEYYMKPYALEVQAGKLYRF